MYAEGSYYDNEFSVCVCVCDRTMSNASLQCAFADPSAFLKKTEVTPSKSKRTKKMNVLFAM